MNIINPLFKSVKKGMKEATEQTWTELFKSIIRGIFEVALIGALFWIIRHF